MMDFLVVFAVLSAAAIGFVGGGVFVYRIAVKAITEAFDDFYAGRPSRYP